MSKQECLANPSQACDIWAQDYCNLNKSDTGFCGCSTNVLVDAPDPELGNTPIKCWANSCNKNPNAYQFYFVKDQVCPSLCIDKSSITALGSNINSSSFNQASCGGLNNNVKDVEYEQTIQLQITQLYEYGIKTIAGMVLLQIIISTIFLILLFLN